MIPAGCVTNFGSGRLVLDGRGLRLEHRDRAWAWRGVLPKNTVSRTVVTTSLHPTGFH